MVGVEEWGIDPFLAIQPNQRLFHGKGAIYQKPFNFNPIKKFDYNFVMGHCYSENRL